MPSDELEEFYKRWEKNDSRRYFYDKITWERGSPSTADVDYVISQLQAYRIPHFIVKRAYPRAKEGDVFIQYRPGFQASFTSVCLGKQRFVEFSNAYLRLIRFKR